MSFERGFEHGEEVFWHDNGQLLSRGFRELGKEIGRYEEYYDNGQIAEIGEFRPAGEYHIQQFWNEEGEQLLINGTGKAIRKFGASGGDVYEFHYVNGKFEKEVKIQGVIFGEFIPLPTDQHQLDDQDEMMD